MISNKTHRKSRYTAIALFNVQPEHIKYCRLLLNCSKVELGRFFGVSHCNLYAFEKKITSINTSPRFNSLIPFCLIPKSMLPNKIVVRILFKALQQQDNLNSRYRNLNFDSLDFCQLSFNDFTTPNIVDKAELLNDFQELSNEITVSAQMLFQLKKALGLSVVQAVSIYSTFNSNNSKGESYNSSFELCLRNKPDVVVPFYKVYRFIMALGIYYGVIHYQKLKEFWNNADLQYFKEHYNDYQSLRDEWLPKIQRKTNSKQSKL